MRKQFVVLQRQAPMPRGLIDAHAQGKNKQVSHRATGKETKLEFIAVDVVG